MSTVRRQNSKKSIDMLASQRMIYSYAKRVWGVALIVNLLLMPYLTVLSIYQQYLSAYVALLSVLVLALNGLVQIYVKHLVKTAASIQELFDSYVLGIPINSLLLKDADVQELIEEWSSKYFMRHNDTKLIDWYAAGITRMPQIKATLSGQRINSWWDGTLRSTYTVSLVVGVVIFSAIVSFLGLSNDLKLSAFVLTVIVPLVPVFQTVLTEAYRNYLAGVSAKANLSRAKELLLEHKSGTVSMTEIRALQDSIFNHRISSPLVFDFVYWLSRKKNEIIMKRSTK